MIKNFIYDINENQTSDNPFSDTLSVGTRTTYDYDKFLNREVVKVLTNEHFVLSNFIERKNIFINFWFKGCGGCEKEMPEIEALYKKYKDEIQFIIISNDSTEKVRQYIKKNRFSVPFYVFDKDYKFPYGITVFPTTHLLMDNKSVFIYASVGYYESKEFHNFLDNRIKSTH